MKPAGRFCICGKPLGDEFICKGCAGKMRTILSGLPPRLIEVEDTAYRLDNVTAPGGGVSTKGKTRPLPYRPEVGALLDEARNLVVTWVRDTCEHRGIDITERFEVFYGPICSERTKA